jgi:hypothetical protein
LLDCFGRQKPGRRRLLCKVVGKSQLNRFHG